MIGIVLTPIFKIMNFKASLSKTVSTLLEGPPCYVGSAKKLIYHQI